LLKIFGNNDPMLGDPEAVMVNRGDMGSEKQTEYGEIMHEKKSNEALMSGTP
jgi:hypothetical protein